MNVRADFVAPGRVIRITGAAMSSLRRLDVIPTKATIIRRYQEGAVEAIVILRINIWETLDFDDLTPSVRATVERVETALSESRAALLSAVLNDPGITEHEIARITRDVILPHQAGRLKR